MRSARSMWMRLRARRTLGPGSAAGAPNPPSTHNLVLDHSKAPALQLIARFHAGPGAQCQRRLDLADDAHEVARWVTHRSETLAEHDLFGREALDIEILYELSKVKGALIDRSGAPP